MISFRLQHVSILHQQEQNDVLFHQGATANCFFDTPEIWKKYVLEKICEKDWKKQTFFSIFPNLILTLHEQI